MSGRAGGQCRRTGRRRPVVQDIAIQIAPLAFLPVQQACSLRMQAAGPAVTPEAARRSPSSSAGPSSNHHLYQHASDDKLRLCAARHELQPGNPCQRGVCAKTS
mmetsp:Transcript_152323/g.277144  ORF Transcript_152323/g.277144 Transcript_152323/m.277144 type:complete len:104 (+) Transcript_152323:1617-1928(+)